jgi:hypothetical protein
MVDFLKKKLRDSSLQSNYIVRGFYITSGVQRQRTFKNKKNSKDHHQCQSMIYFSSHDENPQHESDTHNEKKIVSINVCQKIFVMFFFFNSHMEGWLSLAARHVWYIRLHTV